MLATLRISVSVSNWSRLNNQFGLKSATTRLSARQFADAGSKHSNSSDKSEAVETPEAKLRRLIMDNPDAKIHWEYSQDLSKAKISGKEPAEVECTEGKTYMWCACGHSRRQPFCDGSHMKPETVNGAIKPIPWKCRQGGTYFLCNCKQTNMRPFCDGTHNKDHIKDAAETPTSS